MKLTNKRAIEIINGLATSGEKAYPLKMSYAISKNLEKIENEIYKPYLKELNKLNEKYKNNTDTKDYEKEVTELLEIENEFIMHTFTQETLEKCEENDKFDIPNLKEQRAIMEMIAE